MSSNFWICFNLVYRVYCLRLLALSPSFIKGNNSIVFCVHQYGLLRLFNFISQQLLRKFNVSSITVWSYFSLSIKKNWLFFIFTRIWAETKSISENVAEVPWFADVQTLSRWSAASCLSIMPRRDNCIVTAVFFAQIPSDNFCTLVA
jgi:hypothetical protein